MKKQYLIPLALFFGASVLALPSNLAFSADCAVPICKEQGGARMHVGSGGSIDIQSGADFDIEAGATFKIGGNEIQVELDLLDGLTASTADLNATTNFEEVLSATTSELTILTGKTLDITDNGGLQLNNTSVSSTAAELNLLDGSVEANTLASVAPVLDSAKALRTNANVGVAGTNVTAVEYGDGYNHVTVLTLSSTALTPTIPADAEGAGAIIYTFPAGVYMGISAHMDITGGTMDSATNAVDLGIGSLISSSDITTLGTTMEDWVTGQTIADAGTFVKEKSTVMTGGANEVFEVSDSHVLHVNIAGNWNNTVSTADVTGTVTIVWTFLGL